MVNHRALRVINDDIIAPGTGFGWHGHRDMEIITWVLSGKLLHKDDTGSEEFILPVWRSPTHARGRGIRHGEWNASDSEPVHMLQIWIDPAVKGLHPGHLQKSIPVAEEPGALALRRRAQGAALDIIADADMYAAQGPGTLPVNIADGESLVAPPRHRHGQLGDQALSAGDGIGIDGAYEGELTLADNAQVLAFKLG